MLSLKSKLPKGATIPLGKGQRRRRNNKSGDDDETSHKNRVSRWAASLSRNTTSGIISINSSTPDESSSSDIASSTCSLFSDSMSLTSGSRHGGSLGQPPIHLSPTPIQKMVRFVDDKESVSLLDLDDGTVVDKENSVHIIESLCDIPQEEKDERWYSTSQIKLIREMNGMTVSFFLEQQQKANVDNGETLPPEDLFCIFGLESELTSGRRRDTARSCRTQILSLHHQQVEQCYIKPKDLSKLSQRLSQDAVEAALKFAQDLEADLLLLKEK